MFFIDNYKHVTPDVSYTKECIIGPGVESTDFYSWFSETCSCSFDSICLDDKCSCTESNGRNYISSFLILDKLEGSAIYECGAFCCCNFVTCTNRLVQKGPNVRLEIRPTEKKGYGLFTLDTIPPGTFICEYAGELISKEFASQRCQDPDNAKYVLSLMEHYGTSVVETYIDAYKYSNIGRYVNHSCSPNSTIIPTRTGTLIPRAAIFTTKRVNSNVEITYSYGEGPRDDFGKGSTCHCESDNCTGYLPLSLNPI